MLRTRAPTLSICKTDFPKSASMGNQTVKPRVALLRHSRLGFELIDLHVEAIGVPQLFTVDLCLGTTMVSHCAHDAVLVCLRVFSTSYQA